jgi:hypothetical protein
MQPSDDKMTECDTLPVMGGGSPCSEFLPNCCIIAGETGSHTHRYVLTVRMRRGAAWRPPRG